MTKERYELRYRQVHLDFNTPDDLGPICTRFDKKKFQEKLLEAHIDSITCFSSCHHGWNYHPTEVGVMHPELKFNLLREQIDACHEINVRVPVYITAGFNNMIAEKNPGWRVVNAEGKIISPFVGAYHSLCFNTDYLDYLCRSTEEVARMFSDADGIFFDIVGQPPCCCPKCIKDMAAAGFDPENPDDRIAFSAVVQKKYFEKTTAAARSVNSDWPVIHNDGGKRIEPGFKEYFPYFSHFELESLPTGGWGYDHFPLLAAYHRTERSHDFLGMTGAYHTTWGEYGGFKHPNALRYECSAMLAQGAKCSIGADLHPCGVLDDSFCHVVAAAYKEVEEKEPWCRNAVTAAEVAMLSNAGCNSPGVIPRNKNSEIGVLRVLQEGHIPFDRLDYDGDFTPYKVLILADDLRPDENLRVRLQNFIDRGGKLILSGSSLLKKESDELAFDLPLTVEGPDPLFPNYVACADEFAPDSVTTPIVMYRQGMKVKVSGGKSLGRVYEPYYRRTYLNFCSHLHTPALPDPSEYDAGVITDRILYFAHPVFLQYTLYGHVILKQYILKAIRCFLKDTLQLETDLPSQGRVTLLHQKEERRYILHALYANTILRGMASPALSTEHFATTPQEVIEELNPLYNVHFSLKTDCEIKKITLEPAGTEQQFTAVDGRVEFSLNKLVCHQMIVLHY